MNEPDAAADIVEVSDPPRPRPEQSRPARWAMVFSVAALAALVWPVYPLAAGIFPMIWGIPLSMFYLVAMIAIVFTVMLGLFLWEDRNDRLG